MTNLPEAKLAREAQISYATLAMSTDYDCWHSGHDDVTAMDVVAVINKNVATAKNIIQVSVPKIVAHSGPAPMASALTNAILSQPKNERAQGILDVLMS
jgi:5'-methylthioadenosine phosphorylase